MKYRYSLNRITRDRDIQSIEFKIIKTYRIFKNPYHRFFILKKREAIQWKKPKYLLKE